MSSSKSKKREWKCYVKDMQESIGFIQEDTAGMSETEFHGNRTVMDAVIRRFAIIGEAASKIPREVRKRYSHIPWRDIISFRNFLVHDYFGVENDIVWRTLQDDLPPLKEQVAEIVEWMSEDSG